MLDVFVVCMCGNVDTCVMVFVGVCASQVLWHSLNSSRLLSTPCSQSLREVLQQ